VDNALRNFFKVARSDLTQADASGKTSERLRARAFKLITRTPLVKNLRVVRQTEARHEAVNLQAVHALVEHLQQVYPGSPIPAAVANKFIQQHDFELKSAHGVDREVLARMGHKVCAYQALLAISTRFDIEQALKSSSATSPGSSGSPGPTGF
jgi:hypothetical protein